MGFFCHHAILVTGLKEHVDEAHEVASKIFPWVSPPSPSYINHLSTILIPPDNSKEGWEESDEGDDRRKKFISWLNDSRFEDGSSRLRWVEVKYDEEGGESISNSDFKSCSRC